jgi:hypothetical protein
MTRTIAYDFSPGAARLVDATGVPVLPIRDPEELARLERIAVLHDAALTRVEALPADADVAATRAGLVVSFGADAADAGALYAHLTGRRHLHAERVADVLAAAPTCVVAAAQRCSFDLMDGLFGQGRDDRRPMPGLVTAPTAADLAFVAKRWATALLAAGARPSHRSIILPMQDFARVERPEGRFIGGAEPAEGVLREFESGSSLALVVTHSNGLDLAVGSGPYFCPFPPERRLEGDRARPICLESGVCTLMPKLPQRLDAWQSGALTGIERIRTQLLLLFTCYGVRFVDRILSPEFGLGPSLSLQATTGAIVTSWSVARTDPAGTLMYPLLNALADGVAVGEALRAFNASERASRVGTSLCLLGDPDYCLAPDPAQPKLPEDHFIDNTRPRALEEHRLALSSLLAKRAIATHALTQFRVQDAEIGPRLDQNLKRYEQMLMTGAGRAPQSEAVVREINADFVRVVALTRPWLDQLAGPFGIGGTVTPCQCGLCGRPAFASDFVFHGEVLQPWRMRRCDHCASIEIENGTLDCPIDFDALPEGRLRLRRPLPGGRLMVVAVTATIAAIVPPPDGYATVRLEWPLDAEGSPEREFALRDLPKGPLRLHVLGAWGDRFGMWATKHRAHDAWAVEGPRAQAEATRADAALQDGGA